MTLNRVKSRILYIITDSGIGGSEKVVTELVTNISDSDFELIGIVVLKNKREKAHEWEQKGIKVWYLGMNRWPTWGQLQKLQDIITDQKPQIVHSFLYHSVQVARFLHIFNKSFQLITSPRVSYKFAPIWTLWVDRFMKRFDDFVITESDAGKRYLREHLNYSEKKLFTVINGVNTEVYKYDSVERSRIRKELGLDEQSIVIGSVGRLHPQKGYDVFIESMRLIKNEYPYVIGIIVGEGPELNNLKALNKSKGEPIQLLGRRMDIGSLLSAMDIYVQSSRYEGLSNAMLEAFAVGLPSVLTAVDGTIDVAKDNENALLVSPGNAIEMKNQIEKIIKNEKLKQKLGKTAQTTAIEHSNINMINHYKTLYRSFLYS